MSAGNAFLARKQRELGVALNEVQQKAVLQTEGPLLLLASPGSGKTTTIIMRIGHLIEEKGVAPSRIKAVTFSRASASDMKERFKRFFPDLPPVDFSTIHSLAFEVMRIYLHRKGLPFQIIEGDVDPEEQEPDQGDPGAEHLPLHKKIILRRLFQTINGENITDDQMDELTTYISYIKNKMIPEERWNAVKTDVKQAERILREYEAFKRSGRPKLLVDYDDMLTIANEALEREKGLLRSYQQKYDYVLTDESQDTSVVQHAIIEKLVKGHGNLCVVADDDQSIYSWRGAEPSYLLQFKRVYPKAVTLLMEQNYRSTKDIVSVANQFIKRNKDRYNKNMFTRNPAGKPIRVRSLAHFADQAKYLVREIQKVDNLTEVAVLYRNNSSSIPLMNEFDRAGIPFYMKDADNRFFSHWVVEDILNFMRMTYTDRRPDLLEKIYTKFNGYVTKQQMAAVKAFHTNESVFDTLLDRVQLNEYQIKPLKASQETFRQMRGMPPRPAIQVIRERLGYEKALEKMCERLGFRKEYLLGILNTLEEIADTLQTMEEFASRLKYLESVLKTAKSRKGQNAVTFSTFHSAKGLEFEQVYMIDLVEGIIPSSEDLKSGSPERGASLMEEATRLFYVGMTRAKQHLELLTYKERDTEKTTASRFVTAVMTILNPPKPPATFERKPAAASSGRGQKQSAGQMGERWNPAVPEAFNPNAITNQKELAPGLEVKHRVFGRGTIVMVNRERVHIRFEKTEKALSIATCLEKRLLEPV
ncbi:MAG: ATP-dependent helicase [Paenibacillus sp.]|jgi:DNA helicase-2/ATP-dependent DNA helicase PcrA|uniref:ATP-dependent helicase n=1 Tax=Paenibacillus sp. GCM10012303 TaxID=3317340 RepID=UPI0029EA182A|nr:ATP-dependent helicase [Paenibacillus sp.]